MGLFGDLLSGGSIFLDPTLAPAIIGAQKAKGGLFENLGAALGTAGLGQLTPETLLMTLMPEYRNQVFGGKR